MTIHYTSPHHRPEDPGGQIREALNMGADFPGPAQDLLLSWTLKLEGIDAPTAARHLIEIYALADREAPDDARGDLIRLLRQTAALESPCMPTRRRGGRRARLDG
jgi:hypothetical protein